MPLLLQVSADAKALSGGRHEIALTIRDAATLTGSRDELASAFGNLVSNAVRYTPDGRHASRSTGASPTTGGEFTVADTGIGIAAEHVPRLTERFYRVDRSRSRATGGTGLGLAIVKHVLMRHQAELDVDERAGRRAAVHRAAAGAIASQRVAAGPSAADSTRRRRRRLPVR